LNATRTVYSHIRYTPRGLKLFPSPVFPMSHIFGAFRRDDRALEAPGVFTNALRGDLLAQIGRESTGDSSSGSLKSLDTLSISN